MSDIFAYVFLTKLLMYLIPLRAAAVVKPVILGILPSISVILAL